MCPPHPQPSSSESSLRFVHCPRMTRCIAFTMLVVVGQPTWAGKECDAPPEKWQPRSAVAALAERNGWLLERLKVDDGCYEIKGRDAEGRRFKAKIDPGAADDPAGRSGDKLLALTSSGVDHNQVRPVGGAAGGLNHEYMAQPGVPPAAPAGGWKRGSPNQRQSSQPGLTQANRPPRNPVRFIPPGP